MEKKQGPLAVRKITKGSIPAIRGMGAREAKAKLAEMQDEKNVLAKRRKIS